MKGLCRAIDRGLYIVWRDWEDWYAFAWFVVFVAAVFGLAASIWVTVEEYSAHDWHVFGVYVLSEVLLVLPFGPDKTKKIRDLDGTVLEWTIDAITRHGGILDLRDRMVGDALGAALWGGGIGAGLLIGAVFVVRIVHWRNSRKRRRDAKEKKQAALAPRCRTGLSFDRILRFLSAFVRFVSKAVMRYAIAGSTGRGDAIPPVVRHRAADAAASDSEQGRGYPKPAAAFGEPTVRPPAAPRSERQRRADAAEAPLDEAHLRFDQRSDGEAPSIPYGTPTPATSPPAPIASAPAALSESANPSRSKPARCQPHSPGQASHDVRASDGGNSAPPRTGPSQEHEAVAPDDGSDDAGSTASRGERDASGDRSSGSSERVSPAASRHGGGRRRRRASQDFY